MLCCGHHRQRSTAKSKSITAGALEPNKLQLRLENRRCLTRASWASRAKERDSATPSVAGAILSSEHLIFTSAFRGFWWEKVQNQWDSRVFQAPVACGAPILLAMQGCHELPWPLASGEAKTTKDNGLGGLKPAFLPQFLLFYILFLFWWRAVCFSSSSINVKPFCQHSLVLHSRTKIWNSRSWDTVLLHSRRSLSDDAEGQNPTSGCFQKQPRTQFHRD